MHSVNGYIQLPPVKTQGVYCTYFLKNKFNSNCAECTILDLKLWHIAEFSLFINYFPKGEVGFHLWTVQSKTSNLAKGGEQNWASQNGELP